MAAWLERTDIKKFVEEQKVNIVTVKSILDIDVSKEKASRGATTAAAGEKFPCSAIMLIRKPDAILLFFSQLMVYTTKVYRSS